MTSEERDEVKQVVQEVLQEEGVAIDDNTIFPMKNSAGQSDALLMMQLDQQHQATDYSRINAENLPGGGGGITIDPVPTEDSPNAVASGGVYDALEERQESLVSGINIKTVNGQSILGSGNLVTESDIVPFDGFVLLSPITIIDGSAVDPDAILYYRDANRFVAKKGNSYYNNWENREVYNDGNHPYTTKIYLYGNMYMWDGTDFSAKGGGSEQIQSDWNQTDNTQKDYIKNKPNIPDTSDYYTKSQSDDKYQQKVTGKGLSTNDYTNEEKQKVAAALVPADIAGKANTSDVYAKSETYNKTELNNMITTPEQEYVTVTATAQTTAVTDLLPATGAADTVYRVGNWDGTQYDDTCYSEYAWNGTTYIKLRTKNVGIDDEPIVGSDNLVKSGGIALADMKNVPVKSSDELFDRSTTIQNMDINSSTGALIPNDNYCCSPLIPLGYRTKVWVEAYDRKLYCYDANGNYLGRTGMAMWGISLSWVSSDFANVAFVRILFTKDNAATARIGLREKENLVKDYFDYDTLPQLGSEGLVYSEPILNCINNKIATLRAMGFDDLKLLYKSGNTIVTINDNFNRLALIGKVSAGSSFSFIFNELLKHHALRCYVCVFATYDLAVQDSSALALQNISGGWKTIDIEAIINYDGYIAIDVDNQNSSNYTIRELEDVVRNLNIVIDKKIDNSYYLNSWVKGDWSNGANGPYLTNRQYKIRNANWLFLKKGTIIEGFFISTGQTAHVDIWDATSGTAIDVNTNRTSNFKVTLAQNSKVLVWTSSAVQNPTNTDITINVRITEPSPMNVNKVTKLKIATFNTGDYTFANSSIVKGSDDARTKFREVVAEIDADIIATQEDVPFFNDTDKSLPRDEVFGMFKYGYRPGIVFGWNPTPENNPNYHGFYSTLKLDNVRGEWYNLTSEQAPLLGHYMFAVAELHIDGKVIAIANVHYDWSDKNARTLQVQKVLDFCSQYKYAIIIGDFNPENRVAQYNSSTDKWESIVNYPKYLYSEEWQTYKDAGYVMANDGYFGTFNTCEDEGGWHPYDNIICSQNIAINKAWMVEKSYMNDHKPVVAEIIIY